jgi:hypothetical protein
MKKILSCFVLFLLAGVGLAQSFQMKEQFGNWLVYEKYDSFSETRERYFLTKPNRDGLQLAILKDSTCDDSLYLYKTGGNFSDASEITIRFKATSKYRETVKSNYLRFYNNNPELVLLSSCAMGYTDGNGLGMDLRQQSCKWNQVLVKVSRTNGQSIVTEIDISQLANMMMKYKIVNGRTYSNMAACAKY